MNTFAKQKYDLNTSTHTKRPFSSRIGYKIGLIIVTFLGSLLGIFLLLPVALLPFITAVPLMICLVLIIIDAGLLIFLFSRAETILLKTGVMLALAFVALLAVLSSQWFATTPPILGADGQPLPGSIAELERVELNGRDQWITMRGHDVGKPVLLFLAGGPGGSQLAATRKVLGGLEEHFVVVNWDQPGAGKSYRAADFDTLTPEKYIADAHALTLYLRDRFGVEKIYILGESWGSLLGVGLVERYPEQYHAFVGAAQMVAFLETDAFDYDLALQIAAERGDNNKISALQQQGPPPYYGSGVAKKVTEYILYLSTYMNQNPEIHSNYDTLGDIFAPEYGLYDKVNYIRGLLQTMEVMWPQLWDVDLRTQTPRLEVPIYILEGRHDINAPPELAEDYIQQLDAPHKELIWFDHSGHSPWVEEPQKVMDLLITLAQRQDNK